MKNPTHDAAEASMNAQAEYEARSDQGRTGKKDMLRGLDEATLLDMRVDLMQMPSYTKTWEVFILPALADVDDVLEEIDD